MSERKQNAQYGTLGSKEELAASGYKLPDSFFVEAAPDGSGGTSEAERKQLDAMSSKADAPAVENKAVVPATENKKARKTTAKRK